MTDTSTADQDWLDNHQYTADAIRLYEQVYGEDFVSPGGRVMSMELLDELELSAGQQVLDVGCGLGGSAFLMASHFRAQVTGIDLSMNMLRMARSGRARHQLEGRVRLEHQDCMMLNQADEFDAIYSRDVFLHIADKVRLFGVLHQALKPGGKLLFTDYACGPGPWHPDFGDYVASRAYHLHTTDAYAHLIERAGFHDVRVADWTGRFIQILLQDLHTIASLDLPDSDRDALTQSWQSKLARAHGGDHRWIKASATSA